MIHESIVDQITPSMRAHVQVEGIGDRPIEGHFTSISPMTAPELANGRQVFRGNRQARECTRGAQAGHDGGGRDFDAAA